MGKSDPWNPAINIDLQLTMIMYSTVSNFLE